MNPDGQSCKDDICDKSSKYTKNHDVSKVLEESLPSHIVARGEDNGRDAEVEENVVVENDILLNHIIAGAPGYKTYQEANTCDIARLMPKGHIS